MEMALHLLIWVIIIGAVLVIIQPYTNKLSISLQGGVGVFAAITLICLSYYTSTFKSRHSDNQQ